MLKKMQGNVFKGRRPVVPSIQCPQDKKGLEVILTLDTRVSMTLIL